MTESYLNNKVLDAAFIWRSRTSYATHLTLDSLTQLSWCRGHFGAGYVLSLGTSWCQNVVL